MSGTKEGRQMSISRRKSGSLSKIQRSRSVEEQVQVPLPLGYTKEQEQQAFQKLKERFSEEIGSLPPKMVVNGDEDACLLRFLRARQYNLDAVLTMLKNTIDWRKKNNVDNIQESKLSDEVIQNIRSTRHSAYTGFDKMHRPIYVEKLGKLDAGALFKSGVTEDQVLSYHIQEMEIMSRYLLKKASKESGQTVDSIIQIYDVTGLGLKHMSGQVKNLFSKLVGTDSDNYPETNAGVYVINSSTMFQMVYRIVEPMMDPRTTSKIKLFGGGANMKKKVKELFDPTQIPEFVGGEQNFEQQRQKWGEEMDNINLDDWDNDKVQGQSDGKKDGNNQQQQQQENGIQKEKPQKTTGENAEEYKKEKQKEVGNSIPLPPGRVSAKPNDGQVESQFKDAAKRGSIQDNESDGFHTPKTEFSMQSGKTAFFDATKDYGSVRANSQEVAESQNVTPPQQALKDKFGADKIGDLKNALKEGVQKITGENNQNDQATTQNVEGRSGESLQSTLTAENLQSHREMLNQNEKPESPQNKGPVILDDGSVDGGDKEKKTVTKVVEQIMRLHSTGQSYHDKDGRLVFNKAMTKVRRTSSFRDKLGFLMGNSNRRLNQKSNSNEQNGSVSPRKLNELKKEDTKSTPELGTQKQVTDNFGVIQQNRSSDAKQWTNIVQKEQNNNSGLQQNKQSSVTLQQSGSVANSTKLVNGSKSISQRNGKIINENKEQQKEEVKDKVEQFCSCFPFKRNKNPEQTQTT